VDVRIIAASALDVGQEVRAGRFREDLFFRINVVRIDLPPLRDRGNDVCLLASHFVSRYSGEMEKPIDGIDDDTQEILRSYSWPGNVRELQNVIRRAIALTENTRLSSEDLPDDLVVRAGASSSGPQKGGYLQLRKLKLDAFEREYLAALLEEHKGDTASAARKAEIPRGTLYRLLKRHDLRADDFRS
jgi:DNA-binding NtrC family response regulator